MHSFPRKRIVIYAHAKVAVVRAGAAGLVLSRKALTTLSFYSLVTHTSSHYHGI